MDKAERTGTYMCSYINIQMTHCKDWEYVRRPEPRDVWDTQMVSGRRFSLESRGFSHSYQRSGRWTVFRYSGSFAGSVRAAV